MDSGTVAVIVIPMLSTVTGLITAIATLTTARAQARKLASEANRTGVPSEPKAANLVLADELARLRMELDNVQRGNA